MLIVDAHQHFWDPRRISYPWLPRSYSDLDRPFEFLDLEPLLAAAGVTATVLVQSADSLEDTDYMFEVARAHREIAGVVGWVPLDDPSSAEPMLEHLLKVDRFCGVRNLVHERTDPDWVIQPKVLSGLRLLEDAGVPFDLVAVLPRHLEHVPTLCERLPRLRLVIDHLGKPPLGTGGIDQWKSLLAHAADCTNVWAKLSGIYRATPSSGLPSADELRAVVHHALEAFGAERLMFGSDWPICEAVGGYHPVTRALFDAIGELDEPARRAVLAGTAIGFYGLDLSWAREA